MSKEERTQDLEVENRRLVRAALNRWSSFDDQDLRTLTACIQAGADHVGEVNAALAERYVREIGGEIARRSTM